MEDLVSPKQEWSGRRVLVTGDTGFKGSWLSLWLHRLGADVTGFALPPPTRPSLFEQARLDQVIAHVDGDVRDHHSVQAVVDRVRPEIIFHLAAQPLVRLSYDQPMETYATNVMGTVHLLEAARRTGSVTGFVAVTSDKCYENREWVWPYRESDPMGGADPYSSSKGCAELVVAAYRQSFWPPSAIADGGMALASVRAGNVIGGGDYAADRLVPDLVRAFESGEAPTIRSPEAVRPWQHVLEALSGYIAIGERLLSGDPAFADAWNFGPAEEDARPVSWIVERMRACWEGAGEPLLFTGARPHEAGLLRLDTSKVRAALGWRPALTLSVALEWVVEWHKRTRAGEDPRAVSLDQIGRHSRLARESLSR